MQLKTMLWTEILRKSLTDNVPLQKSNITFVRKSLSDLSVTSHPLPLSPDYFEPNLDSVALPW